jgi:DNA-binding transcriptional ArsR family regulator
VTHGLLADGADEVFAALADRTRRRILVRLAERPDDAGAVARDLEVSRQAVAKHLRVLEDVGIVQSSLVTRRRVHRVAPSRIREVSDLLGAVAAGWDRRLAGIKERAEERERTAEDPAGQRPGPAT